MDLREITLRVVIQPARGKTLMQTEAALRNAITKIGYVREIETLASEPKKESK